jgi:outer membrane protein assembly factor BamD (BamD/ComL family)/TM2 domain-containing membrane protein YozV
MNWALRSLTLLLLSTMFGLGLVGAVQATPNDLLEAERLFAFGTHLMEEKDYYRAITEFKRFLSYFPEDSRGPLCRLNIALAYKKGGKTDLAVEHFQKILRGYPGTGISERASFEIGATYFHGGKYAEAAEAFSDFIREHPTSTRLDEGRVLLGWSLIHLWDLSRAAQTFSTVSDQNPQYAYMKTLAKELEVPRGIHRKSPVLAGVMSALLPGSGQIYTGRLHEGLTSFILNGSFIWAIVDLFGHGNEAAGLLLGFFETGWYSGGVFGAVNDAHKYNRKARNDFILGLERRFPPPSGD